MEDQAEPLHQSSTKIDPITAVQDSIDSLALSLFEALRGVRDAVAPESLETGGGGGGGGNNSSNNAGQSSTTAFKEAEELADNATAEERVLNGLNVDYFPPRAFDLLEPDYDAFLVAYLSGNVHAKELVDRYMKMEAWEKKTVDEEVSSSISNNDDATSNHNNQDSTNNNSIEIGDVGYEFQKQFDAGWFTGKVTQIVPVGNEKDRRCVYNDGDIEDLSLEELHRLAKLDPNNNVTKPKISIKLKVKQTTSQDDNEDGATTKEEDSTTAPKKVRIPLTQEEYTKFLIDSEHQRDIQTTQHLAQQILHKSAEVDNLVARLPGMDRTRDMQMKRIEELLERNQQVAKELEEAHAVAKKKLEEVRKVLGETTSLALGVEEE
ncbi:putative Mediator complex subunit 21 [Skeletonema marinoi]|uniref:Mediator of RNA polymerase II transcription subunit 21 n=1 Tax=Skeletonema marinoi TaxID=267567 RepID=A0AAD8Y3B1_9STRA|nr:putative Mediator complex subunit 21 [Skeletonema marinoi]